MKTKLVSAWLASMICITIHAVASDVQDSLVRVYSSMRLPNPVRPWAKQNPVEVSGSGVVIDGRRILTNAHVVIYGAEVFVQGREGGDRAPAKVASLGVAMDLAVLTLEDDSFFTKRPPIERAAKRPAVGEQTTLLGFAAGGAGLAVTRGPVSRIEYGTYSDEAQGLRIRVDAAASPGTSGGAAIVAGKLAGLVFQRTENSAYVIPNEEIDEYLKDVKDGRYDGKPMIVGRFQGLTNESLRKRLGLAKSDRGIMVREPVRVGPPSPLREYDVLTHVAGIPIDNEGMIELEPDLRLVFLSVLPRLTRKDFVPARVIRDRKPLEVEIPLTLEDRDLFKNYTGEYPSYFVHGPLIFSPVYKGAVESYLQGNPSMAEGTPLLTRLGSIADFPGEEIVIVTSPMLHHKMMRGYNDPFGWVVKDVDGVRIKNLAHLVEVLRDGKDEFLTIRFFGEWTETMVLPRRELEKSTADLMAENGIPKRGSADVVAIWDARDKNGR